MNITLFLTKIYHLHCAHSLSLSSPRSQTTINLAWIAYFFLIHLGEYCHIPDHHPLTLHNVTVLISTSHLHLLTAPPADLLQVTHASLTFDDQKTRNGVGSSPLASVATPLHALSRCSSVRSFTFACTLCPSPFCCAHTTLPEPATSPAMMSPHHYCSMPLTPLPCWASPHWTSMPTACAPVGPPVQSC